MNYSNYIKTYEDLARQVGGMVLANDITIRNLDLINGDFGAGDEIFQFYIISDPDFLLEHTDGRGTCSCRLPCFVVQGDHTAPVHAVAKGRACKLGQKLAPALIRNERINPLPDGDRRAIGLHMHRLRRFLVWEDGRALA